MADEWQIARIQDVAEKVGIGPFGSSIKVETFVSAGIPVINGQHLRSSRLEEEKFNYITEDHADRLKKANVGRGDVVFTHRGNIGQVSIIPRNSKYERYVISQSQFFVRCNQRRILPDFLVYYFRSAEGQQALLSNASQVGVPSIAQPVSFIRTLEIPLPPIPEQKAIVHILSTLEDKIELNRKMNETLEAMARALFKSWFVDFDPIRAKTEGRDTGLPKEIAGLFPDEFEDSKLGEIPKGWGVGQLGDLVNTVKGCSYKSDELVESDTALVTLKSFARGGGYRPDGLKSFAGRYKAEQVVDLGEVVIACTDVTQAAEVIGHPAVVRGATKYRRLVASLDTLIVRPSDSRITRAFLYFLCGTEAFEAHTYAHTTGTTVLHLSKEAVPSFTFSRPSEQLVQRFNAIAAPALDRIQAQEEESGTLSALRDALLPKLISGELRVPDAEKIVETFL